MTQSNATSAKVEVTIAEGNSLMLAALSEILESDGRFSLVSTVNSAEACLQTSLTVPSHVLVIDWALPTLGAEKLIKVLRDQECPMRVVVCTHAETADIPKRAMAAGAAGFFSHAEPTERLLDVVADVAAGNMVFPYLDVRELSDPLQSLTRTENALLASLSLGRTNKELAEDHGIAVNTVKFHLRNLYDKLSVKNRSQAIALYYSLNLPDYQSLPAINDASKE
jgi:two-component system nitrate/nitrite response regulator NarP